MEQCVREKLDRIDELFPPERLAASIQRWNDLWNGVRPSRQPYCLGVATFAPYDDVDTPRQRLLKTLDEIVLHGVAGDDLIPSVFPGCRQATIPNMFGASEIVMGDDYACEQLITCASDIDRLAKPTVAPGTIAFEWLEMQKYFWRKPKAGCPCT